MTTINPYALETLSNFLKGKVIIVTGGNSGIGKAIVETIGRLGAKVVIDYRSHPEATEAIEEEIGELGGTCIGVQADVGKLEDLQRLINEAVSRYGRLDVMVNNAGIETRTSILDTTPDDFDKVLNVNLRGVFFATQYAAKQMIAQGGGGRVINISSVHEDWPMPNNTPYCVAKGGVRMLTRTAGVELAPHGVSIVNVGPGAVATPINDSTMNNPELLAKLNAAIPMGRMAQPEEIAKLVAFLASDSASYITATTIFADGGIMQSSPGLGALAVREIQPCPAPTAASPSSRLSHQPLLRGVVVVVAAPGPSDALVALGAVDRPGGGTGGVREPLFLAQDGAPPDHWPRLSGGAVGGAVAWLPAFRSRPRPANDRSPCGGVDAVSVVGGGSHR